MSAARYLVGIDLGTVNTALASVDLLRGGDLAEAVEAWAVPQLTAPGQVAPRRLLPSALYLPGPELPPEQRRLPWAASDDGVVGALAQEQGARVPGRLVLSAKSWLANPRADRRAPILPWGAPEGVPRVSPVAASARTLSHLRGAWDAAHPGAPLGEQELSLAVPASFDEVARELTLEAAREAGLARVSLLEEPSAAFHDFALRHRADLPGALGLPEAPGASALVLVVDVGGGTTDLTLVRAAVEGGKPTLVRLAVGQHLLLGGDNMDLALARLAEARLPSRLDAAGLASLVHACRAAKEALLAEGAPERAAVAVVGRGSRLLSGAASAELSREEVRALVLDGFFPAVSPDDRPRRGPRAAALSELGLPYEPDAAVTRHVAAFLAANAAEAGAAGGLARPDALLVNGGVFAPPAVRARLVEAVSGLFPGAPPVRLLGSPALDLAVARGAVASALVRRGIGLRMGGGSPRAYYVGIATPVGERCLCVVPRHLEEGSRVEVPRPFTLALGKPVRFPLFASVSRRLERPGELVPPSEDLQALPALEAVLGGAEAAGKARAAEVPVRLEALLTEIGTLELWCVAAEGSARWKLEFGLRGGGEELERAGPRAGLSPVPRQVPEAARLVEIYYGTKAGKKAAGERGEVKGLVRALEKLLGPRTGWTTPVLRELWAALHAGASRRRRSPDHERVWAQLTGFALRPGFGAPLDAWRAAETFSAFEAGLQYRADPRAWQEWWVLWRRIAGGLDGAAQERLLDSVEPLLAQADPRRPQKAGEARPAAPDEIVRLLGSLERIAPERKVALGEALLARLLTGTKGPEPWALGRIGARVPFAGSAHQVVPSAVTAGWVRRLLDAGGPPAALAFPLAQLARRSGDRARDLPEALRAEVARALAAAGAPPEAVRSLEEVAAPSEAEEGRIFGESLPAGLRLVPEGEPGE